MQKLPAQQSHSASLRVDHRAKFNLLRMLVRRDLEARYKGSLLGNLWPLLNQVSQLLIYTYVFSVVLKVKLDSEVIAINDTLDFGLWLFAGLVPWIAFSGGLSQAAGVVVSQTNLVKKVVFPLELLPLVPVLSAFIESAFGIAVLVVVVAFAQKALPTTLALLPLVWIPQLLLTAGLAYLTAGLTVFLRDIPQTLGLLLNLWMYATPIIYPIEKVPEAWQPWVYWLNPMTAIVETYRDLVLAGKVQHASEWMTSTLICFAIFMLGRFAYRHVQPAFADVL